MASKSALANKKDNNNSSVFAASILITAGSIILCYFQYDLWTDCEHLSQELNSNTVEKLEYKPSTCESSAACSWAAAAYLGVGLLMLWIEKHRSMTETEMRAHNMNSDAEIMAMTISVPPVSIPCSKQDETPQGDKLQVV